MIALLLAVTQFLIAGAAAARWLERDLPPRRLLGVAYLCGSGICAFVLLALSLLGIAWTPLSFTLAFCLVAIALWVPLLRRAAVPAPAPRERAAGGGVALLVDACTLLLLVRHGAYALRAAPGEWDFWAIWGLKARVFFEHAGIDWAYLAHPDHAFAHPDYPPLLPLNYVQLALLHGGWTERGPGLLSTLFAAALLLVVRDLFAEEFERPWLAALATLAVASYALTVTGTGDAPMIAYGAAGLLLLRRGSFRTGAVLLGLAAFTKNEGLALVVATAIALLLTRRRDVVRLWPAVAIPAPWIVLRAVHALPTDLATGNFAERATNAAARVPELWRALADHPPSTPLLWLAVAIALVAYARALHRERFLLIVIVLQLGFYLAAYLVTPHQLHPHVGSSWARILQHMAVPAAFVVLRLART